MDEKVNTWRGLMKSKEQLELDLYGEYEVLTQKIFTKIMFGDDAEEGMQIAKLHSEQDAISFKLVHSDIVTSKEQVAEKIFHGLIERRLKNVNLKKNDWVSVMVSSKNYMSRQQRVDECCAVLIASSKSTSILLAWACLQT
ncbi:hypothetical protein KSP39_PZI009179 [Platanthera zijinensis]|uniref:Uncharacterized protein n=1 Tax=Platanthera zijinensis TaxID=2320716 RepID=A0AAP0BK53_9ASPA